MTSSDKNGNSRYPQRQSGTIHGHISNEQGDTQSITNRRHSLAHVNFRKAIDRSLSLTDIDDDNNHIQNHYLGYLIKFLFLCFIIVSIGLLIRFFRFFEKS
ncbi:hypothetical protein I4U23_030544 [Adineta vaga]|nr:hypothetical protein I4U23_030544 [Adineta vaga]